MVFAKVKSVSEILSKRGVKTMRVDGVATKFAQMKRQDTSIEAESGSLRTLCSNTLTSRRLQDGEEAAILPFSNIETLQTLEVGGGGDGAEFGTFYISVFNFTDSAKRNIDDIVLHWLYNILSHKWGQWSVRFFERRELDPVSTGDKIFHGDAFKLLSYAKSCGLFSTLKAILPL